MHRPATEVPPIRPADLSGPERSLVERYHSRRYGWKRFARDFRGREEPLLSSLSAFPDAVLVAGCQRSGTTLLTRLISASSGFRRFVFTHDDELDAALILAGGIRLPVPGRYCFQTTYLNERCGEYRLLGPDQRLIWVVRNPHSVVYSMVHNWRRYALDELYHSCGRNRGFGDEPEIPWWKCVLADGWAEKASRAYLGKASHVFELQRLLPPARLLVVDYDSLVRDPAAWLPHVFAFIHAPAEETAASRVRRDSIGKSKRLSDRERALVDRFAQPTYERTLELVSKPRGAA